jgi:hypothetical protein
MDYHYIHYFPILTTGLTSEEKIIKHAGGAAHALLKKDLT